MRKSIFMRITLIVGSILIIVGVSLMMWMLTTEDERNVIKVSLDSGDSKPIKFEALKLVPGDECEYTVKLVRGGADNYSLKMDFVETGDGMLKNFARVKIITGDNVVYDELLADTIENENIMLPIDLKKEKSKELRIVYYLPLDVGNEAKNAEALVGLILTASNE